MDRYSWIDKKALKKKRIRNIIFSLILVAAVLAIVGVVVGMGMTSLHIYNHGIHEHCGGKWIPLNQTTYVCDKCHDYFRSWCGFQLF